MITEDPAARVVQEGAAADCYCAAVRIVNAAASQCGEGAGIAHLVIDGADIALEHSVADGQAAGIVDATAGVAGEDAVFYGQMLVANLVGRRNQIGRASCRERVWRYV